MRYILIVAGKEFRDGLRNRWVVAITLIFALFSMGLAYFGGAASGTVGFTSLATTIVSLASLAVFLIPLIALLLAYDTVVGEQEQGTLLLLLTYPLSRVQLLAGKFLGHGLILAVSSVVGFGAAAVLIALSSSEIEGIELWQSFAFFILSATLLGWVFVAFAYLISVSVSEKSRAAGTALVVWFVFVLIFDLGLLGLLVSTGGKVGQDVFPYLLLLNPTDVFRLANLACFEPARTYAGLASIVDDQLLDPLALISILTLWVVLPFGLAAWRFQHREI
jgi:Cu-processing system permease protein